MQKYTKKGLLFFMLVTFVIGTMVPFFASYNVESANNSKLSALLGGKVLICTSEGFKWVDVANLAHEKERIPLSHYKCPLCYIAAKHSPVTLSGDGYTLLTLYDRQHATILHTSYHYIPLPKSIAATIQSRAPPFSFIA